MRALSLLATVCFAVSGMADATPVKCGSKHSGTSSTHYYLPILQEFKTYECKTLEGQCVYRKNGVEILYNDGIGHQPRAQSKCKYGYGNRGNCLTPCLSVAADRRFHQTGEMLYFPKLKGTVCNGQPHTGIVRVDDVGGAIKGENRFDFYIGECRKIANGVCFEPAGIPLSEKLNKTEYCALAQTTTINKIAMGETPDIGATRMWSQFFCHSESGLNYRETQIDSEGMASGEILNGEGLQVLEIPKLKILEKARFTRDNPKPKSAYKIEFGDGGNRILHNQSEVQGITVFSTTIKITRVDGKPLAPGVDSLEEAVSCKDEWALKK